MDFAGSGSADWAEVEITPSAPATAAYLNRIRSMGSSHGLVQLPARSLDGIAHRRPPAWQEDGWHVLPEPPATDRSSQHGVEPALSCPRNRLWLVALRRIDSTGPTTLSLQRENDRLTATRLCPPCRRRFRPGFVVPWMIAL